MSRFVLALALALGFASAANADSICDPDGLQASGSVYRICMPSAPYNGMLVIWAHGFQDAGTPVGIPEDQLCFGDFCIPTLINDLGFAFATNSYSKTGLAIRQGKDDILDLVEIFAQQKGQPQKVFLVGASEGGIITALAVEQHPEIFSAGVAACGPIGDFRQQINYFGDARATFQAFFPGLIPGDPFNPPQALVDVWAQYYELVVKPIALHPANRARLDQWAAVARLPFDAANYLADDRAVDEGRAALQRGQPQRRGRDAGRLSLRQHHSLVHRLLEQHPPEPGGAAHCRRAGGAHRDGDPLQHHRRAGAPVDHLAHAA